MRFESFAIRQTLKGERMRTLLSKGPVRWIERGVLLRNHSKSSFNSPKPIPLEDKDAQEEMGSLAATVCHGPGECSKARRFRV